MPLPVMTPEQRAEALKKAQAVRSERAAVKAQIKAGEVTICDLLDRVDDPVIGNMRVRDGIAAVRGFGKVTTANLMEKLGIDEKRRFSGLGVRQQDALRKYFGE